MDKKWIYYGVFFAEPTKNFLINKAKEFTDIPEKWNLYADHMTIVFNDGNDGKNEIAAALDNVLGMYQQLCVTSIGISDEAIAFEVNNYKTQNEHSHITIAIAPGSKPVKSNNITDWLPIDGFYVTGKIGKITKTK